MNVSLTPELEKLVNEKVESGKYKSASEVVKEGLRLLKEREDELEALRRDIREGFEDIERGDYIDVDDSTHEAFVEDIKARGRLRLAELNKQTGTR